MKYSWLDRAPLPTGVVRAMRFVYANQALLDLLVLPREALLDQPFLDRVAPEDRRRVHDRHAARMRGERVPDAYELRILRGDGARRTVELWVSVDSDGYAIFQLYDRTASAERQVKLAALARLGVALQGEPTEEAVLEVLSRGLVELGIAMARLDPDAAAPSVRVLETAVPGCAPARLEATSGGRTDAWGPEVERAWREGTVYLDELPPSTIRLLQGEPIDFTRAMASRRGVMIRIDRRGATAELLVLMADWLGPEDLPACGLFGAQLSAARDAARMIREEQSRSVALAALNRIAAGAAAAANLEALFARGTAEIVTVIGCDALEVYLIDEERSQAVLAYSRGETEEARRLLEHVPLGLTNIGMVARDAAPRVFHRDAYDAQRQALLDSIGQRVIVSVPLVTRGKALGVMNAAYRDEHDVLPREIELMQAAGAHFAAAVDVQRLIADLRRSYADLARAQEQLVQRERLAAIGELAAVVAHEVRNPLGVFFNSIGALRKVLGPSTEEPTRTLLGIMDEEAARLNHIVSDLLDFARPTAPAMHREPLEQLLDDAAQATLGEDCQRVTLVREMTDLPPVPMDARLIRQAMVNLVDNAVQAMPEGGTLTLRLARDDLGGMPMARVDVGDTGLGIPPEVEARIFEPFFTTRAMGTGLGLAVVKRIVESHHGRLRVSTAEGHGTTFTFWLPLEQADAREDDELPDFLLSHGGGPRIRSAWRA